MSKKLIIIFSLFLISNFFLQLQALAIDEIEPNNSLETAQQITLPISISGVADSEDIGKLKGVHVTNDLFTFTLSSPSTINAHLQVNSEVPEDGVELHLYNDKGTDIIYWGRTEDDKIDSSKSNQHIKNLLHSVLTI